MKKDYLFILCFLLFWLQNIVAQTDDDNTDQVIADIFEQYSAEGNEAIDFEFFYEKLHSLALNPLNLNQATKEQLDDLLFLSDIQIENILRYIYSYGPLNTIYELQLIDGLDMTDIRNMLAFVCIKNNDRADNKIYKADLWRYGRHTLLYRLDRVPEKKSGYDIQPDGSVSYLGSAFYNSLKYQYRFKDRISLGLTMEKDAGEQFFDSTTVGYDFYSFHAQFNDFGKFKTIVLGDFKADFGLGLVLSSGFGLGKSSSVLNVLPHNSGLKKFSSSNENSFMRGVGATFKTGKFENSVFYSNKMLDADTAFNTFTSFYTTGLHRTSEELNKKNTVNEQVFGLNSTTTFKYLQLGLSFVYTMFDHQLIPEPSGYNQFLFKGDRLTTAGLYYRFRLAKFNFFGETSTTNQLAVATINGASFSPISQVSLVALMRYFSKDYDTFYANTFSENSGVNNEQGIYIGAEVRPVKKWKVSAYADSYRFPWLKYGVDAPSLGQDYLLQIDYAARRDLSMFWRLKYEEKLSTDNINALPVLVGEDKSSFRYQLIYNAGNFTFKNIIEASFYYQTLSQRSYGLNCLQDVSYKFKKLPLRIDFRYQFFDAPNYNNRFYTYEKDVLYAFSIPMYYGQGSRYYLNLKYELNRNLSFWLKLAQTTYSDSRETISSGNEQIQGNRKTDLRFLLQLTL